MHTRCLLPVGGLYDSGEAVISATAEGEAETLGALTTATTPTTTVQTVVTEPVVARSTIADAPDVSPVVVPVKAPPAVVADDLDDRVLPEGEAFHSGQPADGAMLNESSLINEQLAAASQPSDVARPLPVASVWLSSPRLSIDNAVPGSPQVDNAFSGGSSAEVTHAVDRLMSESASDDWQLLDVARATQDDSSEFFETVDSFFGEDSLLQVV